jgi:ectoine hydroxylase-related dioxygenase (phytanoyl-CoA dioxygenase family)
MLVFQRNENIERMSMSTSINLPNLSSDYTLTNEHLQEFHTSGVTLVRGLASADEVAAYRPAINKAVANLNTEKRALKDRDTYGMAFLQTSNLWAQDEVVKQFSLARRFAKVAADLMGVSGVRMYHDQALYKEPGGGPTPWHQDQNYWPLDTDKTVTMWMPLLDIAPEVGTLSFARGSHREGFLGDMPISDKSEEVLKNFVRERGYEVFSYGAMNAGDATFHTGWTLHAAPGNPSKTFLREVMTVIYVAEDARISEADSKERQNDLKMWLPGQVPGDVVGSPLNPVVYSSSPT